MPMHLSQLSALVQQRAYVVDAPAVAEALLRRSALGRPGASGPQLTPPGARTPSGAGWDPPRPAR